MNHPYSFPWIAPAAGALILGTTTVLLVTDTAFQEQESTTSTSTITTTQCHAATEQQQQQQCTQTTTTTTPPPFHQSSSSIKQSYDIQQVLGEGAYGIVFEARRKQDGLPVALKAMTRTNTPPADFQREVKALQLLSQYHGGHPGVCQLYGIHQDEKYYYLAMELIQGGELLDHLIQQGKPYSEQQAAAFLRQFAEAIQFVHDAGYTHADLKLENLLLSAKNSSSSSSNNNNTRASSSLSSSTPSSNDNHNQSGHDQSTQQQQLKVVDFGCAIPVDEDNDIASESDKNMQKAFVGTVAYWPPELFHKRTRPSPATDMWAAGCIVYILVTGTHPFDKYAIASDAEIAKTVKEIGKNKALLEKLVFDERTHKLSSSCLQLIKGLMNPDPTQRMTSEQFLRHPWVQGMTASWDKLSDSYQKLEAFWQKRFRDEVLKKFASTMDLQGEKKGQLSDRNLAEIFQSMDLDGNGTLELDEVQAFFQKLGFQDKNINEIFDCVDLDGTGVIHFDEFRTLMRKRFDDGPGLRLKYRQHRFRTGVLKRFATRSMKITKQFASDKKLREMFDAIDLDGNGVLDAHEIRLVLRAIGEDDEDIITRIVASVDLNRDGGVSWEEFQEIMRASSSDV